MAIASVHTDINIHFSKNKFTNDISMLRDIYSIRQSIMNIILTIPGEKPFLRSFGTRINDSLFDNFNYIDSIATIEEIKFTVRKYEPRIELEHVIIKDSPIDSSYPLSTTNNDVTSARAAISDDNQLFVYISYFLLKGSAIGASSRDSISIGLTKTR
jgi:phage baseplate assembly protein W